MAEQRYYMFNKVASSIATALLQCVSRNGYFPLMNESPWSFVESIFQLHILLGKSAMLPVTDLLCAVYGICSGFRVPP